MKVTRECENNANEMKKRSLSQKSRNPNMSQPKDFESFYKNQINLEISRKIKLSSQLDMKIERELSTLKRPNSCKKIFNNSKT